MSRFSLDEALNALRNRSDEAHLPSVLPERCLRFQRARVLSLDPERGSDEERAHVASCRRCAALVASFAREVPHLSQWSLVRRRLGFLSEGDRLAADYHLEAGGCRRCRERDLQLGQVAAFVRSCGGVTLPHPSAAAAGTADARLEAASADGTLEADLGKTGDRMVLEARSKDPSRRGALIGFALRGAEGREERGYLVLAPDVQGWYAASASWGVDELYAALRGTCTELLVYPADRLLWTDAEHQALLTSASRSRHEPEARAAWLEWVSRTEQAAGGLSDDLHRALDAIRQRVEQP